MYACMSAGSGFCVPGSQGRSLRAGSDSLEERPSNEAGQDSLSRGKQGGHFLPGLLAVGMENKRLLIKTGTI